MKVVIAAIKRNGKEYCLEVDEEHSISGEDCCFIEGTERGCARDYPPEHICSICTGIYFSSGISGGWAWREI